MNDAPRVCVVGPGTRFFSGISVYTHRLVTALESHHNVSVILIRQMMPTWLYPGKNRVGATEDWLDYPASAPVFNGLDWYLVPSLVQAARFLVRERPDVLVLQWWTATSLHSYIALAALAHSFGAKVVIEFHETQDTGEARLRYARWVLQSMAPLLMKQVDAVIAHSQHDADALVTLHGFDPDRITIVGLGPFDKLQLQDGQQPLREAPAGVCNVLCFGVLRPYKGVDHLIRAFNELPADQIDRYWLTVVGETWEGYDQPAELIAASPYRDRITFINRYVPDTEVGAVFAGADVVALPYLRSSASGPLHITMDHGLPVVVTNVGGLAEAVEGYSGAVLVEPGDPAELRRGIERAATLTGRKHPDPHSWEANARVYSSLFSALLARPELSHT